MQKQKKQKMRIVKTLPFNHKSLEFAVESFVEESHAGNINKAGLYKQTLENMVSATVLGSPGFFLWTHEENEMVVLYVMAHISKDVDDTLCYWVTQAWIHKDFRGRKDFRNYWELLRDHAKSLFCKHILIPSSRNAKAYCRFLGHGMHEYVTLLKEDI